MGVDRQRAQKKKQFEMGKLKIWKERLHRVKGTRTRTHVGKYERQKQDSYACCGSDRSNSVRHKEARPRQNGVEEK